MAITLDVNGRKHRALISAGAVPIPVSVVPSSKRPVRTRTRAVYESFTRRHVLASGAGLVVRFTLIAKGWSQLPQDPPTPINGWQRLAWLQVAPDG